MILFWTSLSPWFTSQPNILWGGRPYLRRPHLTRVWGSSIFPYFLKSLVSFLLVSSWWLDMFLLRFYYHILFHSLIICLFVLLPFHVRHYSTSSSSITTPTTYFITDHLMIPVSHMLISWFRVNSDTRRARDIPGSSLGPRLRSLRSCILCRDLGAETEWCWGEIQSKIIYPLQLRPFLLQ